MTDHKVIDVWRSACLCLAGFVLISQLGCAAPQPASASVTPGGFTLDTPIEVIAADPRGEAVLNKNLPGLLTNPSYYLFRGMSLKALASASSGRVSQQTLARTQADLAALPKPGATTLSQAPVN